MTRRQVEILNPLEMSATAVIMFNHLLGIVQHAAGPDADAAVATFFWLANGAQLLVDLALACAAKETDSTTQGEMQELQGIQEIGKDCAKLAVMWLQSCEAERARQETSSAVRMDQESRLRGRFKELKEARGAETTSMLSKALAPAHAEVGAMKSKCETMFARAGTRLAARCTCTPCSHMQQSQL